MLSHFEASYLWGGFADPSSGWVLMGLYTMLDVQKCLEWARSQPSIANPRIDILTRILMFPEKQAELLASRSETGLPSKKTLNR